MDAHKIRWTNFRRLVDEVGGISKAAEVLGKAPAQVTHFGGAKPTKNIGPKIAREIEAAFHKPEGWLDNVHDRDFFAPYSSAPPATDVVMVASTLSEAEKWVRFEEARGVVYQPLRRAERMIELYKEIAAAGGVMPPELAEDIINAVRSRLQGERKNGASERGAG